MALQLPDREPHDAGESTGDPDGFERAFDTLIEAHYSRLCTFALRLVRNRDAAEDAVQEVLLKVWSRQMLANLQDPVPYLYRAVRNQCLMALRRERRWDSTEIEAAEPGVLMMPADDQSFDLQDAIARAVDSLPERTRLVFTMHRQQDLTYGEIAQVLGISVKTVETQMTRALKILRRQLDRFFCAGALLAGAIEGWPHFFR